MSKVILVGVSKSLLDNKLGSIIDTYDVVCRMNNGGRPDLLNGEYKDIIGSKKNIWLCKHIGLLSMFKNNNYDGGIDIRALKEFKEGTVKNLLVQCKHWNKPIPPGEMRDFKAGCDEEAMEHEKILMFITSSQYSPGAREYAKKFNIELVDGDDLLK